MGEGPFERHIREAIELNRERRTLIDALQEAVRSGVALETLFGGADSPGRRMLARLEDEADLITREVVRLVGPCATLQSLIEEWRMRARDAVRGRRTLRRVPVGTVVDVLFSPDGSDASTIRRWHGPTPASTSTARRGALNARQRRSSKLT